MAAGRFVLSRTWLPQYLRLLKKSHHSKGRKRNVAPGARRCIFEGVVSSETRRKIAERRGDQQQTNNVHRAEDSSNIANKIQLSANKTRGWRTFITRLTRTPKQTRKGTNEKRKSHLLMLCYKFMKETVCMYI